MNNSTKREKRNSLRFIVLGRFFSLAALTTLAFLPEVSFAQSAQDMQNLLSLADQNASSSATTTDIIRRNLIASSTAAQAEQSSASVAAANLAAEKNTQDTELLKQIEALRGIVPNSTLDALEKKYQIGAYSPKPASPATAITSGDFPYVFLKNIKQGDTGRDVKMLQIILNRDSDTQVTKTGGGSPGHETSYFGALTKIAVIKFQNKHAAEILIPNGLTSGTGFVGLSTRVVLNTLATGKNVPASSPAATQANMPPKVFYCTPAFVVQHGTSGLTASESASIGCVTTSSKESCEKVDTYTQSTGVLGKDGTADCRWVAK